MFRSKNIKNGKIGNDLNLRARRGIVNDSKINSNLFGNCIKFFTKSLQKIINRIIFERIRIQARNKTNKDFKHKEQNNVSSEQMRLSLGSELGNIKYIKKRYASYGGKREK